MSDIIHHDAPMSRSAPTSSPGAPTSAPGAASHSQSQQQLAENPIIDITLENINEVLSRSTSTPVLLDFWADWCEPCKALMPIVEKLANEYGGAFILGKVNADEYPMIAQQLGVRGLPTLRMVKNGQFVDELSGAQTEVAVKAMLTKHVGEPKPIAAEGEDPLIAQVQRARRMGAYPEALAALQEAITKNPKAFEYQKMVAFILMDQEDFDGAQTVIDNLPKEEPARSSAAARLDFARLCSTLPTAEALASKLGQVQSDLAALREAANKTEEKLTTLTDEQGELLYNLGVKSVISEEYTTALDRFIELLATHPRYKDELGRKSLLQTFEILGGQDPLAKQYRRKMFTMLH